MKIARLSWVNSVTQAGASQAATTNGDAAQRHRRYRDEGLWPGEPLYARYLRMSAGRLDALAVADNRGRRLSHRKLIQASDRVAEEFARAGIGPREVILIAMPNRVEWQILFVAVLKLGAIPATIPVRTDASNLCHVCDTIGARALIIAEDGMLADIAPAVAGACAHPLDIFFVSESGDLRSKAEQRTTGRTVARDPALDHIMFTSSTTGRPKAVMHSADTLAALNITFSERFSLGADEPILMPSPLGHSVGAIHGARLSMFNASPLILQERWDPDVALALAETYRCAFTAAATPFLTDLVDATAPGTKLSTLRWFLCGGAQVPPALMDRTLEELPKTRVTVLWGMTEGGLTTCTGSSPWEKVRSTCGIGLRGLEVQTLGRAGAPLPTDGEGELAMRGPGVFYGYLGQDALYREHMTADGFFRTGDLATVDGEGYVRITGRVKDLIIRGGVNISPVPIEDALSAHPDVVSVAVIGAPDPRMGERLCAVLQCRSRRPDLAEISAFAVAHGLPKYLTPEVVHYIDDMPRTPAGKIRKVDLRTMLSASHDSSVLRAEPEMKQ